MPDDPRPEGLAPLYRQKALVYASMTRVFDAEDADDWTLVEARVGETRRLLADGAALFDEHLARTEDGARSPIEALAADFRAMRASYSRVLDSMAARASQARRDDEP
jgi:hypothetical protein